MATREQALQEVATIWATYWLSEDAVAKMEAKAA